MSAYRQGELSKVRPILGWKADLNFQMSLPVRSICVLSALDSPRKNAEKLQSTWVSASLWSIQIRG